MDTNLSSIKKVNTRNNLIFIADVVLFFILLNTLPFTPEANKSLALLVFIAILWLTEALHVTVTALLVPILGILLGLVKSPLSLIQPSSYSLVALHSQRHFIFKIWIA